jgi:flagellar L-ring protein precursor FlgH
MKYLFQVSLIIILSGCNFVQRAALLGEGPDLSHIQNPLMAPGYKPIDMPMPAPELSLDEKQSHNSLWETGSKAFFKDQRAQRVGDLITVQVNLNEQASMNIKPNITVQKQGALSVANFLGYNDKLAHLMPKKMDPNNMINYANNPQIIGSAQYARTDAVQFAIASTVVQILPNGKMVIKGRQEVRVGNEVRDIEIMGIIRREDISAANTITSDRVSEARMSYSSRGDLSEFASVGWGQQFANKFLPW